MKWMDKWPSTQNSCTFIKLFQFEQSKQRNQFRFFHVQCCFLSVLLFNLAPSSIPVYLETRGNHEHTQDITEHVESEGPLYAVQNVHNRCHLSSSLTFSRCISFSQLQTQTFTCLYAWQRWGYEKGLPRWWTSSYSWSISIPSSQRCTQGPRGGVCLVLLTNLYRASLGMLLRFQNQLYWYRLIKFENSNLLRKMSFRVRSCGNSQTFRLLHP